MRIVLLVFLGGLMVGVLALFALLTAGVIAELLHWQNEVIFHHRR